MAALLASLGRIAILLGKFFRGAGSTLGWGNILGWTIAATVPVAYCLIWVGVLTFAFTAITNWFIGAAPDIFGGSNFPSGAMWLLNQAFPLSTMFGVVVGLLVLRVSAGGLVAVAVEASRFLK